MSRVSANPVSVRQTLSRATRFALESFEDRRLFAVFLDSPISDISVRPGAADSTISLANRFRTTNLNGITGTIVRMPVKYGTGTTLVDSSINLLMYDTATPLTVQNFLNYVTAGRYDDSIIHRSDSGFIQGGGFTFKNNQFDVVSANSPVSDEFSKSPRVDGKVNVRGTIAMVKGDTANSATSQWFINTADNAGFDNAGNLIGGYTVFGRVLGGMDVADKINALTTYNASSISPALSALPLSGYAAGRSVKSENVVLFSDPSVVSTPTTYFDYKVTSSDPKVAGVSIDSNGNIVVDYPTKVKQGTTTITLTGSDLTGATVTDTFTITVATPALAVSNGTTKITSGQAGVVDLGTAFIGQTATRTITLKNSGKGVLDLGSVTVPDGFTLAEAVPDTLAAGATYNLVLNIDTTTERTLSGQISIVSDASDEPFAFSVRTEVGDSVNLGGTVKSVVFTDATGTRSTYSLKGNGTAKLSFTGSNLSAVASKSSVTVTGTNVSLDTLTLDSTDASTAVSASVKGAGASIGTVSSTTTFKQLNLKGVTVTDSISLANGGADFTVGTVSSATVNFGSAAVGSQVKKLTVGNITDSTVVFGGVIKAAVVGSVSGGTLAFSGGPVSSLSIASLSGATLVSTAVLSSVKITGAMTNSELRSSRAMGKFEAGSMSSSTLRIGQTLDTSVPDSASDFTAESSLSQFTIKSKATDAFTGSNLYVSVLGKVSLGTLSDAGTRSTLVATQIGQLSGKPLVGKAFSVKAITSASSIDEILTAAGVSKSRLDVNLL